MKFTMAADLTDSPPTWSSPHDSETAAVAVPPDTSPKTASFGLGLSMPPATAFHVPKGVSGTVTPGAPPAGSGRIRSTTEKGFAMDLAGGSPTLGDAASHATMIMQSRQAKLQRWRPTSSGKEVCAVCKLSESC